MKIILPNNNFGAILMLLFVILIIVVPFVIMVWAVSLAAPWWVAWPVGMLVSLICFVALVKFKS
jgi:hypothetical protein